MARFQSSILALLLLAPSSVSSFSFQPAGRAKNTKKSPFQSPSLLHLGDDDQEVIFGGSGVLDSANTTDESSSLMKSLQKRKDELKQGIGKRYVARTQRGFLNVHYEPTDPNDVDNVVGKLEEGQIVTSTGPTRGFWVPHDAGGWSISKYGGFTWLEPINE